MAEQRDNVYIWTTWLAKLMAGEVACDFQPWFKAHYAYDKLASDFDLAKWTIEHTRALRQLRAERLGAGERTFLENENSFRHLVRPGIWLAGKPDLIAMTTDGPAIYDVKSGQAKTSDQIQLMIYMHVLPMAHPSYRGTHPTGCVVYGSERKVVPSTAVDAGFVNNLEFFVDLIAAQAPAAKAPSLNECRFCDIGKSDCPDRIDS